MFARRPIRCILVAPTFAMYSRYADISSFETLCSQQLLNTAIALVAIDSCGCHDRCNRRGHCNYRGRHGRCSRHADARIAVGSHHADCLIGSHRAIVLCGSHPGQRSSLQDLGAPTNVVTLQKRRDGLSEMGTISVLYFTSKRIRCTKNRRFCT